MTHVLSDCVSFLKPRKQPNYTTDACVVLNPEANPTMIKQLSTRFKDLRGRDAWSFIKQNGLALFEILDGANGYGLVSPREYRKALRALGARYVDEDGTTALQYLNNHLEMAMNLYVPTQAYMDKTMGKLGSIIVVFRTDDSNKQLPQQT